MEKKQFLKLLRILTLSVFILASNSLGVFAQEPVITLSADKNEIGVGEKITLTALMQWQQPENEQITLINITPPENKLLKLIDSRQRAYSELTDKGIFAKRIMEYIYLGQEQGTAQAEPAVVEYTLNNSPQEKQIIKSNTLEIKIVSYWQGLGRKALKGLIFAVFLIIAVCTIRWFMKCNKKQQNKEENPGLSLEEALLEKIEQINGDLVSGELSNYYTRINSVLLEYVKEKYQVNCKADNGQVPPQLEKLTAAWEEIAEKVRFSGYKPHKDEQEKLERQTVKYIKTLIPVEKPEEGVCLAQDNE